MIHFESNYNSVKINAIQGQKLVNNLVSGNETQKFQIGDKVQSTQFATYKVFGREIIGVYKDNGYFYYKVLDGDNSIHTFRQKDLELTK